MFLAPYQHLLRGVKDLLQVRAGGTPRRVDEEIKAEIRPITKLHVRGVFIGRDSEVLS
jgi:hypothetical protein